MSKASTTGIEAAARPPLATYGTGSPVDARRAGRISLLAYSPALILLAIAFAGINRRAESDLWGHIRFGRDILDHLRIARRDTYSYTAGNTLWHNHEWLSQVVFAWVYDTLGVRGLKFLRLLCTGATVVFMADSEGQTRAPTLVQTAALLLGATWLTMQVQFRPQMFTFAMMAAIVAGLARDTYRPGGARLWWIVPAMVVWANLHGGFVAGLVALGTYAAVQLLVDLAEGRGPGRGARLCAIVAAAFIAGLFTPFGFATYTGVLHSVRSPLAHEAITEWRPLAAALVAMFHRGSYLLIFWLCALGLIAAWAALVAITPTADDLALVAVGAVMVAAAVFTARNMALAVIAIMPSLANHAALALERRGLGARETPAPRSRANEAVVYLIAIVFMAETGLFSARLGDGIATPTGAVAFMKKHELSGNILNRYDWGGYLIWHLAPASRVFIDPRYEVVYPSRVIDDYLDFALVRTAPRRALTAYPADFVLIKRGSKPYALMKKTPRWVLVYEDSNAGLFARAGSKAAAIAGIPVTGRAAAGFFP